jgi:4-hydroxy-4-methyl-2-oxoglutarate aldolase
LRQRYWIVSKGAEGNDALSDEPLTAGTYSALISDALDELGLRGQVMDPALQPLRADTVLAGIAMPAVIETTDEVLTPDSPYESEIRAVQRLQPGSVSVYGVAPGNRAAVWGELFSYAALSHGAVGAVIDGYVRDTRQLRAMGYPVFCRGASPLDTRARAHLVDAGVPAAVGGVVVHPGDFIVADSDGVVAIPSAALPDVRAFVARRREDEGGARRDLRAGLAMDAVWEKWQVF